MIHFFSFFLSVLEQCNTQELEMQPQTLATCMVSKGLSLFLCLWVGGQAAAGAQWESLAPAGFSQDPPGSSTTPRNWHWGRGGRGGGYRQVAPEALGDLIHMRDWAQSDG